MNTLMIASSFRDKVCQEIDLESEGVERHIVYTPFRFDDGDHFVVILRRNPTTGLWSLTDEGHTFMHLSYGEVDLTRGTRSRVVEEVLASHGVQNRSGELSIDVPGEAFGDALFSFVQALSRISTTAQWNREVAHSTFLDDFRQFMEETVPAERREFDFADPKIDPDHVYTVDCMVRDKRGCPWFVFAISNNSRCQQATIACYHYERRQFAFSSIAIHQDQTAISRKLLAQLTDVVERQYSSFSDRNRIQQYFQQHDLNGGK
jgi:hypothetical protein